MKDRTKLEEVQFYLDRSQEAFITVLKSITDNPRLSAEERINYLRAIFNHHTAFSTFIEETVLNGKRRGYDMVVEAINNAGE